jgi:hypothetical protein
VQAANAIMAMAPGMVTNCRISQFLYDATARRNGGDPKSPPVQAL